MNDQLRAAEWIEADGLGGFASGTVSGMRTRRYHALLLHATTPPTGRMVLINGLDAFAQLGDQTIPLSTQRYGPDITEPHGAEQLLSFEPEPWPRWRFRLGDGVQVEQEIFARKGAPLVCIAWTLIYDGEEPPTSVPLRIRPFLSGRDYHALQRENDALRFDADPVPFGVAWRPYEGSPGIVALSNGQYRHDPTWYRNFRYEAEAERGLDETEDLAAPGWIEFDLARGPAVLLLTTDLHHGTMSNLESPQSLWRRFREEEADRRGRFTGPLDRAADAYIVRRGNGLSLIAGYPWFADWGRDTFIALRGICLGTGRLDEARQILLEWSGLVSEGMLPNRFPDFGDQPEYNSVDASLWFIVAVGDFVRAWQSERGPLPLDDFGRLERAVSAILNGYARGTRYGIRLDHDGLIACGQPGVQLTWMDAKLGDWVVTPRSGKPVEIQALWLNALRIGCSLLQPYLFEPSAGEDAARARQYLDRWREWYAVGFQSFQRRFWCDEGGYLYDLVDVEHRPGTEDATLRPNQILAVGGLPIPLIDGDRARRVVDEVSARLWTPLGLRTLPPGEPRYRGRYEGDVRARDSAYHQGTAWAWLLGAFVDAWVRVWGGTSESKREARRRYLEPLRRHLAEAGLGHVSEIADGDPPHSPRGCPFQAWSLGELIRIEELLAGAQVEAGATAIERLR
ncbi:MAG: glycogen debranching enzyme family protein [Candidatus Eisenbacteria bacterium]|nr:glycogen debranching enzyme family protein [Candidatus Eisenbacteria bacterium]